MHVPSVAEMIVLPLDAEQKPANSPAAARAHSAGAMLP
jgi:hypothetical protein